MDITCDSCSTKFKLPDEKVPKGKNFTLNCPKCKSKITVSPPSEAEPTLPDVPDAGAGSAEKSIFDEVASGSYDADERPFDFIEEGARTALVCEGDPVNREKIVAALENLEYQVTEPGGAREALKQMRFHVFDMLVINESFDTPDPEYNNLLRYLERLPMATRRDMFVTLLTDRFRTADNMTAFNKSVNLVVNIQHVDDIEKIIKRGVSDNENFYRVYREAMVRTGRA
jgi:predicted Zn finger-like uncharacterized protein